MHNLFPRTNLILDLISNLSHLLDYFLISTCHFFHPFLILSVPEYNILYLHPNSLACFSLSLYFFLACFSIYFFLLKQATLILMCKKITNSIVLPVEMPKFQVANVMPVILIWTRFFTHHYLLKYENSCSLNATVGCLCSKSFSLDNIPHRRHIMSLVITMSYLWVKFRISESVLRGVKRFL